METYFRVSVPAAKSGIAAAVVLGVGRAIGEAMAVMMVAGNVPNMPTCLFQSVRFLTTAVASEMSYSSGLQQQALFSIALVLFLFIMLINAALNFFLKGRQIEMISKKRKLFLWTVRGGMYLATALTAGLTLFLMVYVLAKGIPNITWELLSTKPSYLADRIGILPDILNTLYIIIYTLILVLPLGVGAAIYLTEYAHNKKVVAVIEYAAETLSGIPSIIYGLGGYAAVLPSNAGHFRPAWQAR